MRQDRGSQQRGEWMPDAGGDFPFAEVPAALLRPTAEPVWLPLQAVGAVVPGLDGQKGLSPFGPKRGRGNAGSGFETDAAQGRPSPGKRSIGLSCRSPEHPRAAGELLVWVTYRSGLSRAWYRSRVALRSAAAAAALSLPGIAIPRALIDPAQALGAQEGLLEQLRFAKSGGTGDMRRRATAPWESSKRRSALVTGRLLHEAQTRGIPTEALAVRLTRQV